MVTGADGLDGGVYGGIVPGRRGIGRMVGEIMSYRGAADDRAWLEYTEPKCPHCGSRADTDEIRICAGGAFDGETCYTACQEFIRNWREGRTVWQALWDLCRPEPWSKAWEVCRNRRRISKCHYCGEEI
jgi:hypothetical protein